MLSDSQHRLNYKSEESTSLRCFPCSVLGRELASIVFLFQSRSLLSGQFVGFMQVSEVHLRGTYRKLLPHGGCAFFFFSLLALEESADGRDVRQQQRKVKDYPEMLGEVAERIIVQTTRALWKKITTTTTKKKL